MKGLHALKGVIAIILVMAVFTLFIVPMEDGVFPSWMNTDLLQFLMVVLIVCCLLGLSAR